VEPVGIQALVAKTAVEALYVAILHRLARLDVVKWTPLSKPFLGCNKLMPMRSARVLTGPGVADKFREGRRAANADSKDEPGNVGRDRRRA
jgi:hypothetical protein